MPDDSFVTATEAARLLGVSERTARRYAGHVPDTDRQMPDKGPARYRLSSLRKAAGSKEVPDNGRTSIGQTPDTVRTRAGQVPDTNKPLPDTVAGTVTYDRHPDSGNQSETALIEQLRGEVVFLREALAKEQSNVAATLARLQESEDRSRLLLATVATGRMTAPIASSDTEKAGNASPGELQPPAGQGTENGAIEAGTYLAPNKTVNKSRPFWRFWEK